MSSPSLDGNSKLLPKIAEFLKNKLKLELHPDKVYIKTFESGIDFLGWVHFADHRILRNSTKRRVFRRIVENPKNETYQSYLGILQHGNSHHVRKMFQRLYNEAS